MLNSINTQTDMSATQDVTRWNEQDVQAWLQVVGMQELSDVFLVNGVVGKDLLDLTPEDLLSMKVEPSALRHSFLRKTTMLMKE
mgnify:FL=1